MRSVTSVLLLAFILLSCAGKTKEAVKEKVQDTVVVPDHVELYNPFIGDSLVNPLLNNTRHKIYTLIDASCTACMAKLQKWSIFEAGLKKGSNVLLIPIFYTKDNFEILKYYFEIDSASRLKVPLVLDLDNKFVKQNAALISEFGEMTVLTDAQNVILLKGDPIGNEHDKEEFMKKIDSFN